MKKLISFLFAMIILVSVMIPMDSNAYDGKAAALYAQKHAASGTYSDKYRSFDSDCTNFASQCVKAGGISMKTPSNISYKKDKVYNTRNYWFMKKKNGHWRWSSTWSVVSKKQNNASWGFYNYMKTKVGVPTKDYEVNTTKKLNAFIKACNVGDVIQIREMSDNVKHHSCIVTKKTYDKKNKRYDMKICYHTSDVKNADFRKKKAEFGDNVVWTLLSFTDL